MGVVRFRRRELRDEAHKYLQGQCIHGRPMVNLHFPMAFADVRLYKQEMYVPPQVTSIISHDEAMMQLSAERVRRTLLGRPPFPPSPPVTTAKKFAIVNNIRPGTTASLISAFMGRVHVYPLSPSTVSYYNLQIICNFFPPRIVALNFATLTLSPSTHL